MSPAEIDAELLAAAAAVKEGIARMAITCAHMREVMRQVGAMQLLSVLGEVERGRGEKL